MPEDGHIELLRERTEHEATITESGPGIAPADLPHVLEPLYHGDATAEAEG